MSESVSALGRYGARASLALAALVVLVVAFGYAAAGAHAATDSRSPFRVIITSDAEIDDVASFHRLLLHMNDFADSVEGIVYSASTFHWAGDPNANPPIAEYQWAGINVYPDIINGTGAHSASGGYNAALENLRKHDPRYPSVEHMNSLIKIGNITMRGEYQKDTEGSNFIKAALLDNDPRPVFLPVWGGTNTVAAALHSIENQYKTTPEWPAIYQRVTSKAKVHVILDQDETYKDYIDPHWPDLDVLINRDQFWSVGYSFNRATRVPPAIENAFYRENFIVTLRNGPLLSTYPVESDYPEYFGHDDDVFLSEGDSPSYWELLQNGLRSWEDWSYGGWGGRYAEIKDHRWTDWPTYVTDPTLKYNSPNPSASDPSRVRDQSPYHDSFDATYAQARWIPALQYELAARSEWQTKSFEDANHAPVVGVVDGKVDLTVSPGEKVTLAGTASDPDGDALVVKWWQYREAGSSPGEVELDGANRLTSSFSVPVTAQPGQTIHMILEVQDRAQRPMIRYTRVIATVKSPDATAPGEVGGTVPGTLALTLGASAQFAPFIPGADREYTAGTTANVVSTAGNATLSVHDASTSAPGHLVNGPYTLTRPLEIATGGTHTALSATPIALRTWDAPVSNASAPIGFRQSIAANDALRTGTYSKTLTFALSTTAP